MIELRHKIFAATAIAALALAVPAMAQSTNSESSNSETTGSSSDQNGGYGPGWMMGPGYGSGPGWMMQGGPGWMGGGGYGPGWMMRGYYGRGMGPGMMYGYGYGSQDNMKLTTDQVKKYLGQMIRNPNLIVGDVKEKDADTIMAEIVTKKGNELVQRLDFNRHTGFVHPEH